MWPTSRKRRRPASGDIAPGMRSLHLRLVAVDDPRARVSRPVHILFYRTIRLGLVEIVRVLHERMEPTRHFGPGPGVRR
jgi:toxin ParE1/3/4